MVIARSHCKDPGIFTNPYGPYKLRNHSIGRGWVLISLLSRTLLRAGLDAWPDLIKYCSRWWFQICFVFTLIWGRWTQFEYYFADSCTECAWVFNCDLGPQIGSDNLTNIFQRGWNHQLVLKYCLFFQMGWNHQLVFHCQIFVFE